MTSILFLFTSLYFIYYDYGPPDGNSVVHSWDPSATNGPFAELN